MQSHWRLNWCLSLISRLKKILMERTPRWVMWCGIRGTTTRSISALDHLVKRGKALYAGLSSYDPVQTRKAIGILRSLGTPCLIHQPKYSMFKRGIENELLRVLEEEGVGCIAFSPLAQGLLTDRYLKGVPGDSRAAKPHGFLKREEITQEKMVKIRKLRGLAEARLQSLARMAVAWVLRHPGMTSALVGASKVA
ncbi:MAG: aldo/keto reductase [Acidobacteriota bacterium]